MSHVAGFTVAHDVSARDWQLRKNGGQWLIGKTFDTFCPIGPAIVPRSALSGEGPRISTHELQCNLEILIFSVCRWKAAFWL